MKERLAKIDQGRLGVLIIESVKTLQLIKLHVVPRAHLLRKTENVCNRSRTVVALNVGVYSLLPCRQPVLRGRHELAEVRSFVDKVVHLNESKIRRLHALF